MPACRPPFDRDVHGAQERPKKIRRAPTARSPVSATVFWTRRTRRSFENTGYWGPPRIAPNGIHVVLGSISNEVPKVFSAPVQNICDCGFSITTNQAMSGKVGVRAMRRCRDREGYYGTAIGACNWSVRSRKE